MISVRGKKRGKGTLAISARRSLNVLISSVGRRQYLLDWFRSAGEELGVHVELIGADNDPYAPAMSSADARVILPRVDEADYADSLVNACKIHGVHLYFSLHDYDIARVSASAVEPLTMSGISVAVPPRSTLDVVSDKLASFARLGESGLCAPRTFIAGSFNDVASSASRWVIKHRFGSGSSGVHIVDATDIDHAVRISSLSAPDRHGSVPEEPDPSLVVVQEAIDGTEYGIDVVCDLEGQFVGVLARQKLRMRSGETDRAITVDSTPFESIGRDLASALELRGTTDVDIIVSDEGEQYIIDINPRFGGGYPFMHMAGASIPACYLAWTLGQPIDRAWLEPEVGVVSSKYEAIQRSGVK